MGWTRLLTCYWLLKTESEDLIIKKEMAAAEEVTTKITKITEELSMFRLKINQKKILAVL